MINSLEVIIQYLKASGLSTSQIASKHRFGESWEAGSKAIVVRLDGGTPDIDVPVQDVRVEVRCYAASDYLALELLNEITALSRSINRELQNVSGGGGLLYFLNQTSGQSVLFDPDLNMDFALQFFVAKISETGA